METRADMLEKSGFFHAGVEAVALRKKGLMGLFESLRRAIFVPGRYRESFVNGALSYLAAESGAALGAKAKAAVKAKAEAKPYRTFPTREDEDVLSAVRDIVP